MAASTDLHEKANFFRIKAILVSKNHSLLKKSWILINPLKTASVNDLLKKFLEQHRLDKSLHFQVLLNDYTVPLCEEVNILRDGDKVCIR